MRAQLEYVFFCAQKKPKSSWYKEGRGSGVHLHEYEVLRGRLGADPLRWYENNVFSEDVDESVEQIFNKLWTKKSPQIKYGRPADTVDTMRM